MPTPYNTGPEFDRDEAIGVTLDKLRDEAEVKAEVGHVAQKPTEESDDGQ